MLKLFNKYFYVVESKKSIFEQNSFELLRHYWETYIQVINLFSKKKYVYILMFIVYLALLGIIVYFSILWLDYRFLGFIWVNNYEYFLNTFTNIFWGF